MDQNDVEKLAREERNRYAREWRAKNKARVKEINRRYWKRKALGKICEGKSKSGVIDGA